MDSKTRTMVKGWLAGYTDPNESDESKREALARWMRDHLQMSVGSARELIREALHLPKSKTPFRYRNPRGRYTKNPRGGRFDRCVRKVTRSRSARNPYAVCAPTLKPRHRLRRGAVRKTRQRNITRRGPRGELFSLIARKGTAPPMVYTGDKFARSGRPVLFPSLATAKATARFMQRQYPTLRAYSIWAREV